MRHAQLICHGVSEEVLVDEIVQELSTVGHVTMACDEWTDCAMCQSFRVRVHSITPTEHRSICLSHWPIETAAGEAEGLCEITATAPRRFFPTGHDHLQYVVSDTTNVMPKMMRAMAKRWMPFWSHFIDLILHDILEHPASSGPRET
jgi:hypothetical protein